MRQRKKLPEAESSADPDEPIAGPSVEPENEFVFFEPSYGPVEDREAVALQVQLIGKKKSTRVKFQNNNKFFTAIN